MYPFCGDANFQFFFLYRIVPNTFFGVTTSPDFQNFDFKGVEIGKKSYK